MIRKLRGKCILMRDICHSSFGYFNKTLYMACLKNNENLLLSLLGAGKSTTKCVQVQCLVSSGLLHAHTVEETNIIRSLSQGLDNS
jgi:hypothetical protein